MGADVGESESDSDVAFALMDFSGVNFDSNEDTGLTENDKIALAVEQSVLFSESAENIENSPSGIRELYELLSSGKYEETLMSTPGEAFFGGIESLEDKSMAETIRDRVYAYADNVSSCVQVELLAVAAFNLFLQLNYTGPSLDRGTSPTDVATSEPLASNPHECFKSQLNPTVDASKEETKEFSTLAPKRDQTFHNKVLSELAVDGEWPCQVCQVPYLLLVARSMLFALASPQRKDWTNSVGSDVRETEVAETVSHSFSRLAKNLKAVHLWSARAAVAHERLLQAREPSITLWEEVKDNFQFAVAHFCEKVDTEVNSSSSTQERRHAAIVALEWGLAHHHFNRPGQGKLFFRNAKEYSGLQVEVTGAVGKRTKFQQESTAQMVVRATSINQTEASDEKQRSERQEDPIKAQMIEHEEDGLLLERIQFDEEKENKVTRLSTLDQSILLSLCLDVKNNNPADGLTAEQMGAYLARVLDQHDDWMVYSTALLERAWLECERTHGRERAILQIQALADQHMNRLTITQSTFESIEDSAPPQERLQNLHSIVYPPRWAILRDLAERYAKIGIVTSAAELFEEVELWDGVVECYRHAGKLQKAEQIVRKRLDEAETPRMWAALGDLTNDPSHYHKALELSNGRFSDANVALGKYYFDKGELDQAAEYYQRALKIRPLMPIVWFRLGAISMQLGNWKKALNAFTEVVQQEPEEAEAWANVAAVHMHNSMPAQAYPALNEVRVSFHFRCGWNQNHSFAIHFFLFRPSSTIETIGGCGLASCTLVLT
jgi:tetratricopeptide (TPR) repeat protein